MKNYFHILVGIYTPNRTSFDKRTAFFSSTCGVRGLNLRRLASYVPSLLSHIRTTSFFPRYAIFLYHFLESYKVCLTL